MNKLNRFIKALNFKKIVTAYLIAAIVAAVISVGTVGYVFRNKLSFAWQYLYVSERYERKNTNIDTVRDKLDAISASSADVVEILALDKDNKVIYSANESEFSKAESLTPVRSENKGDYFTFKEFPDVAFDLMKSEEFMLPSVFADSMGQSDGENENDSFFVGSLQGKTIYMLGYINNEHNGEKILFITNPGAVSGGTLTLEIIAALFTVFVGLYWVLFAAWIYQRALLAGLYGFFWGLAALFTNIACGLVFALYKHSGTVCPSCGAAQNKSHIFCSHCGKRIGVSCPDCGAPLDKNDFYCHKCGNKI